MSVKVRSQKEKDASFREALVAHGEFRNGVTVLEHGCVEVSDVYASGDTGVRRVRKVTIISDKVTIHAYNGLRVVPVDDESGHQPAQIMGIAGEVDFDLAVHSVRFATV
jgi:hypothetical protein